ncbi:MAG: hypothetical protein NZM05_12715, partial [Chloroherpetonaceae bacterium]|nr:hypothetical protein [Chloroherpetonaceae bacterium]
MKEIYQRAFQVIKEKMEDFSEIPYFNFSFVCENGNEMTFGVDIPKVIFKGVSFSEYEDVAQQFLSQITE